MRDTSFSVGTVKTVLLELVTTRSGSIKTASPLGSLPRRAIIRSSISTGSVKGSPLAGAITLQHSTRVKVRYYNESTWSALIEADFNDLAPCVLRVTEIVHSPRVPAAKHWSALIPPTTGFLRSTIVAARQSGCQSCNSPRAFALILLIACS